MVKYSGKVSLRSGNVGRNKGYSARSCRGKDVVNNKKYFCTSENIFGKEPQGILCKKHFTRYKKTAKNSSIPLKILFLAVIYKIKISHKTTFLF